MKQSVTCSGDVYGIIACVPRGACNVPLILGKCRKSNVKVGLGVRSEWQKERIGSKIREKERERINSLAISRNKSILGKQKVMSPEENLDSLSKMICSFHFYRLKEINKKYIPEKYENNHFVAVFYKCGFNRCKRA